MATFCWVAKEPRSCALRQRRQRNTTNGNEHRCGSSYADRVIASDHVAIEAGPPPSY
jgi:hypothetical protein